MLDRQLLDDPLFRKCINQLRMLVGVTQNDFKILYLQTIENAYLAILEKPTARSVFVANFSDVILALKRRRGYLLPLGADSETVFRQQEEWTFAVFSAASLKNCYQQPCFDLAKTLLPPIAFDWLNRNTMLFDLWKNYLDQSGNRNIFHEIINPIPLFYFLFLSEFYFMRCSNDKHDEFYYFRNWPRY